MALAAEIRHVFGAHLAEFRGKRRSLPLRGGFHVHGRARVAVLTSDARLERIEGHPALVHAAHAVTTEACDDFLVRHLAPHGFHQTARPQLLVAQGDGQAAQFGVIGDHAFIKAALVLEDESLAVDAERILNGQ